MKLESCLILSFEYSTTSKVLTRLLKEWCDGSRRPIPISNICCILCGENNSHHPQKRERGNAQHISSVGLRQRWYILERDAWDLGLYKTMNPNPVIADNGSDYLQRGIIMSELQLQAAVNLSSLEFAFLECNSRTVSPKDYSDNAEPSQWCLLLSARRLA